MNDDVALLMGIVGTISGHSLDLIAMVCDSDEEISNPPQDEAHLVGPGRGNTILGQKAAYERTPGRAVASYESVRGSHNPNTWNCVIDCQEDEFDDLFELVAEELLKPMNVRLEYGDAVKTIELLVRGRFRRSSYFFILPQTSRWGWGRYRAGHVFHLV